MAGIGWDCMSNAGNRCKTYLFEIYLFPRTGTCQRNTRKVGCPDRAVQSNVIIQYCSHHTIKYLQSSVCWARSSSDQSQSPTTVTSPPLTRTSLPTLSLSISSLECGVGSHHQMIDVSRYFASFYKNLFRGWYRTVRDSNQRISGDSVVVSLSISLLVSTERQKRNTEHILIQLFITFM